MRLYLWILSRILPSYEADSPVSAYASVDASSDSAFADTSLSLVAAASSSSASERVEVEQAHSLKEAFRPGRGLFRWFGLGKSGPRLWFLGRMPTYAMYDSSDYSYARVIKLIRRLKQCTRMLTYLFPSTTLIGI